MKKPIAIALCTTLILIGIASYFLIKKSSQTQELTPSAASAHQHELKPPLAPQALPQAQTPLPPPATQEEKDRERQLIKSIQKVKKMKNITDQQLKKLEEIEKILLQRQKAPLKKATR